MPSRLEPLEEAVESFLRQEYPNKELVIINDSPGQSVVYEHPEVIVINSPERFVTLGDKLNAAVRASSGDYLCRFDDDDISLPFRLSRQVRRLQEGFDYLATGANWFLNGTQLVWEQQKGYGHTQGMYRRSAFDAVQGYPSVYGTEDADMHYTLCEKAFVRDLETPAETSYIIRWGDGLNHLSGHGPHMQLAYERNAVAGVPGTYSIRPHWKRDYMTCCRLAISAALSIDISQVV